jgi:hypothetical protein
MERVIPLIVDLYAIVEKLEAMFPGRSFTPDGHMVGSIGEAWAEWLFDLTLLPSSTETHDAKSADGRFVQIKATQGTSVALYGDPEVLLVLSLARDGSASVVYNGPGAPVWSAAGKVGKNGQRPISLAKLRALDRLVGDGDRLAQVRRMMGSGT